MNNKIIKELEFFKVGFHSYRESYIDYLMSYYRLNTEYTVLNTVLKAIADIFRYVLIIFSLILIFNGGDIGQVKAGIGEDFKTMFQEGNSGQGYIFILSFCFFIFIMFHEKFSDRSRINSQCEIFKHRIFNENKYNEKDIQLFNQTMNEVQENYKENSNFNNEIEKLNKEIRQSFSK